MSEIENLIDINGKKGLPRSYRFNQFARWFTLIVGTVAIFYTLWFIFFHVYSDTSTFKKFLPFAILFLLLNSVLKNLFYLNKIHFTKNHIKFSFLARKSVIINWQDLLKMEFMPGRQKMIKLTYLDKDDKRKTFLLTLSFPNMLEIVNSIAELAPQMEYDEFLKNVIISEKEKENYRIKVKKLNLNKK